MGDQIRVGILGWGAIGREVAALVDAGAADTPTATQRLTAVASRFRDGEPHALAVPAAALAEHCDVVVEAAGPEPLRAHASAYLRAGADVVVVSIGALVDDEVRRELTGIGPGRLLLSSGAIGGLDLISAAQLYGSIDRVRLETTKPSASLVRAWMTAAMQAQLTAAEEPVECFRGSVADAVRLFPESLNVAAALGLAAGTLDLVEVVVVGSPTATTNSHQITVSAASGRYSIAVENTPSPSNPRTSHLTAWSVLRTLRNRVGPSGSFL
ncbi:MAG: aspartate dehydrogenase domain-containing protein [Actinomycetota bacterium]